jgi:hypothetical protein
MAPDSEPVALRLDRVANHHSRTGARAGIRLPSTTSKHDRPSTRQPRCMAIDPDESSIPNRIAAVGFLDFPGGPGRIARGGQLDGAVQLAELGPGTVLGREPQRHEPGGRDAASSRGSPARLIRAGLSARNDPVEHVVIPALLPPSVPGSTPVLIATPKKFNECVQSGVVSL